MFDEKIDNIKRLFAFGDSEALVNNYDACFSSSAVFDALIRTCTALGATDDAYNVIKKLRSRGYWISIHA